MTRLVQCPEEYNHELRECSSLVRPNVVISSSLEELAQQVKHFRTNVWNK